MLKWALAFILVALAAAVLGLAGIAGTAGAFAKVMLFLFLVVFAIVFVRDVPRMRATTARPARNGGGVVPFARGLAERAVHSVKGPALRAARAAAAAAEGAVSPAEELGARAASRVRASAAGAIRSLSGSLRKRIGRKA